MAFCFFFLTLLCGGIWRFLRADAGCGSRREAPDCGGRPAYQAYDYSGRTLPARRPGRPQRRLTPAEQKGLRPAAVSYTHLTEASVPAALYFASRALASSTGSVFSSAMALSLIPI